jgi:hypothetical protein
VEHVAEKQGALFTWDVSLSHKSVQEAVTNSWSSNTKKKANKFINLRYFSVITARVTKKTTIA